MNSLKEILPPDLIPKIHKPLKKCYDKRQEIHGVSEQTVRAFPAFDEFHKDLVEITNCLTDLNGWLETMLSADSEACLTREESMAKLFPKIVGPPEPKEKLDELKKAEGKTIKAVEFGGEEKNSKSHQSEGIIFHFTDGSSMAIVVGSNTMNLALKFNGLSPEDVHTDLMVFWAPSTAGEP